MRRLLKSVIVVILLAGLGYAYLFWQNNRSAAAPQPRTLKATLEKGIGWLESNQDSILAQFNPMLWRMIQQAAELSGEPRLQQLFGQYEQKYLDNAHGNLWRPLFYPGTWTPVKFEDIASFPYYNWHLIYAITCDRDLEQVPEITAQNKAGFCDRHPLRPACVTHQLMGIRLLQDRECGTPEVLADIVEQLQQRIHRQLTLDPRVVDVYLQRVLMLAESGDARSIKPIWLQNVIEAQRPDGGWSGVEPLLPLGAGRYLGFGSRGFTIRRPVSDFHATAQGVLLFSILVRAATDSQ